MKDNEKPRRKTVSISSESKRLVEQRTPCDVTGAVLRPDGRYDVQLDDDVLEMLGRIDPDIDKAIEYACHRKH